MKVVLNLILNQARELSYLYNCLATCRNKVDYALIGISPLIVEHLEELSQMLCVNGIDFKAREVVGSIGAKRNDLLQESERLGYKYALILDPDERLSIGTDVKKIVEAMEMLNSEGCKMNQVNYDRMTEKVSYNPLIRIAKTSKRYSFDFHEVILESSCNNVVSNGTIYYIGYDLDLLDSYAKAERNLNALFGYIRASKNENELRHYLRHVDKTMRYKQMLDKKPEARK